MKPKNLAPAADDAWTTVIRPETPWWDLNLRELWRYRDLIALFVRRDLVAQYKQTVLGPLWFLIQPLFTTVVFTIVFGKIARIPTDGIPPFLFYLSGTVVWSYFSGCLTSTSNTFVANAGIFGKVYFPRLAAPLSQVISRMAQFLVQMAMFLGFWAYYWATGQGLHPNLWVLALPLLVVQMAMLALGVGILISSLTTKYRDLTYVMGFGVQLWMYATPVVYPLSQIPERYHLLFNLNPMTAVVESFRYAFLGTSALAPAHLALSWSITLGLLVAGALLFNRIEKNFMDTV